MARLTREFVKLETRILNDWRFFTMSEFEQLVYVKLLGISRSTNNRIPKESAILVDLLRLKKPEIGFYLSQIGFSKQEIRNKSIEEQYQIGIESALKRIKANFPKFMENKYFYYFEDYELRLFNSAPKQETIRCVDEDKDLDEDKDVDKGKKRIIFSPPTIDELKTYCTENNLSIQTNRFLDFYQAKGWMVGKNKMKDWKAAVRNWASRDDGATQTQARRNPQPIKDCTVCNGTGKMKIPDGRMAKCFCIGL